VLRRPIEIARRNQASEIESVNTSAFYKGESQEKKLRGDWKEQRFLPGSPAHVMLGGSWGFLFSQSHVVYQDLNGRRAFDAVAQPFRDAEEAKRWDNGLLTLIMPTCPDEQ